MTPNRPTGVLVDVDGTLVDTTYVHTLCWWEALRQGDHDHFLGADRDRSADSRLRNGHDVLFGEYWERLQPLPGAADLLRACAARHLDIPCVAVISGGTGRAELADAGAAAVYDDPADLLANFDRSPLANLA